MPRPSDPSSELRARSHSHSSPKSTSPPPSSSSSRSSSCDPRPHHPPASYTPRYAHPIKSFYLPHDFLTAVLAFPSQVLFALMGMLGLAHYARQIVRVRPRAPGTVALRSGAADAAGVIPLAGHKNDHGENVDAPGEHEHVDVDQWIVANTPSLSGSYTPSWWLPNGHLQTFYIVSGDFSKTDKVDYVRTLIRVPDGGTLALDMTPPNHESLPADAPTVMVCHGLTGNANESYVRNVLAWVVKPKSAGGLGGRGVVVNFRGCGGTPVTSAQLYSAAASCDPNTAAHYLRATFPQSSIHGIGFSLGAAVLARYLSERGVDSLLSSGIVLACPWDITEMSHALEDGWFSSRVYSSALGQNLVKMFFRSYNSNPKLFDEDERIRDAVPEMKRLREMGSKLRLRMVDEVLTTRIGGPKTPWPMANADAYYAYAGSHQLIHNVKVPLLGINAFDDPVVHGDALPITQVSASSHVHLAVTGAGGHLGWFDGPLTGSTSAPAGDGAGADAELGAEHEVKDRTSRWIRRPIAEFLTAAARDLLPRGSFVTKEDSDGWTWVDAPPRPPQTGAEPAPVGWKVLETGVPLAEWSAAVAETQGIQGL